MKSIGGGLQTAPGLRFQMFKDPVFMIPIHIHAVFRPDLQQFVVQVNAKALSLKDSMSIDQFLRFARSEGNIVVGGTTIQLKGARGEAELKRARQYFRDVAASYVKSLE